MATPLRGATGVPKTQTGFIIPPKEQNVKRWEQSLYYIRGALGVFCEVFEQMAYAVFTYGTLLSERVLLGVLGRVPERVEGRLFGYQRTPIRSACYPAVIKAAEESVVHGKILLGVSAEELAALDAFEDPAYSRVMVEVHKTDGGKVQARLWMRPADNQSDLVLDKDWDFDRFVSEDEDWYVIALRSRAHWASTHRDVSKQKDRHKDEA